MKAQCIFEKISIRFLKHFKCTSVLVIILEMIFGKYCWLSIRQCSFTCSNVHYSHFRL